MLVLGYVHGASKFVGGMPKLVFKPELTPV